MTEPPRTLQERLRELTCDGYDGPYWTAQKHQAMLDAAAALDAQSQLLAEARDALGNLVTRLDEIHEDPAFNSVWVVNQLNAGPYTGPKYETELNKASAVLAKLKAAQTKDNPQ